MRAIGTTAIRRQSRPCRNCSVHSGVNRKLGRADGRKNWHGTVHCFPTRRPRSGWLRSRSGSHRHRRAVRHVGRLAFFHALAFLHLVIPASDVRCALRNLHLQRLAEIDDGNRCDVGDGEGLAGSVASLAKGRCVIRGLPVHLMILRWPDGPVAMPWPRSGRTVRDRRRARRSGPRRQCRPGGRTSRPGPCAARASPRSP